MRPKIMIAYDATPAAADGLALGRATRRPRATETCIVARVLPDTPSTEATERALQAIVPRDAARDATGRREASARAAGRALARLRNTRGPRHPGPGRRPWRGPDRARLAPPWAARPRAARQHRRRWLAGAPCAVAVAPRRFRRPRRHRAAGDRRRVRRLVRVRGGARRRRDLARAAGAALRHDRRGAVGLEPADPPSGSGRRRARGCAELAGGIEVETVVLHGDPARSCTRRPGRWACSSAARGPVARCAG